jgi:16S rRNA (guanine527-N7)-methyltransferase
VRGGQGNATRKGNGETRARTDRVGEDLLTGRIASDVDAGSGSRTAHGTTTGGVPTDRPRGPLPTRVQDLPPLPAAYRDSLDGGLRTAGIALEPAMREAIDGHVRLLLAWTRAINLTAIRDPVRVAVLHVLDSLVALPVLRAAAVERLVDLGSGGGFPGIPLAAALPAQALLVESVGKKARFLETAVAATGLAERVAVANERAETIAHDERHRARWPAVVARAVASLDELAELAIPLLAPDGLLVAWKQEPLTDELEAARPSIDRLGGGAPEVHRVDAAGLEGHRLVIVRKTRDTPLEYPRPPAERRRGHRRRVARR